MVKCFIVRRHIIKAESHFSMKRLICVVMSHTPLRFTLCSLGTSPEAHILSFHIHQKFHASLGKRKSFLEHFFFFQLFTFVLKVILWDLCWYSCHTECIKWNTDIKRTRLMYSKNKNNRSNMVPPSNHTNILYEL